MPEAKKQKPTARDAGDFNLTTEDIDGGPDGLSRRSAVGTALRAAIAALGIPGAFGAGVEAARNMDGWALERLADAQNERDQALNALNRAERLNVDRYSNEMSSKVGELDGAVNVVAGIGLNTTAQLQSDVFNEFRENPSILIDWFTRNPVNGLLRQIGEYNSRAQVMQSALAFIQERNAREKEEVRADTLQVYLLAFIFSSSTLFPDIQEQATPTSSVSTESPSDPFVWLDNILAVARTAASLATDASFTGDQAYNGVQNVLRQVLDFGSGSPSTAPVSKEEGKMILLNLLKQAAGEK